MGRYDDQKIYRTFEEFEREELRRDVYAGSMNDLLDDVFADDLDFDASRARKSTKPDDDDE